MKISIIIPVFNEEKFIIETLKKLIFKKNFMILKLLLLMIVQQIIQIT